jgi:hypothetical protein
MLTELLEDISETAGFSGQRKPLLYLGKVFWGIGESEAARPKAYAFPIL